MRPWLNLSNGPTRARCCPYNGYMAKKWTFICIAYLQGVVLVMSAARAEELGLEPMVRIVAHNTHAQNPGAFTTAPIESMQKLVDKARWNVEDVDLFEINEAFAMVTMMAMDELALPHDKVNVNGGACALGHPLGASGARILVTLLHALKQRKKTRGVASLCIGGGEATSIAIEMLGTKT